jgi:diadenosine tetraphosphate (Ap4A) HIT family hydrolase
MTFQLADRLQQDSFILVEDPHSFWLLLNNQNFPWFILVPKTDKQELFELSAQAQKRLQAKTNQLSRFITEQFPFDKLNIASIGNIVRQLHIHVIARSASDPCWPGVVWGTKHVTKYKQDDVEAIKEALQYFLSTSD